MLYDGLAAEFAGKAELRYALGCNTQGDNREGFAEALDAARWSDVVVLCLGEMMTWSGENASLLPSHYRRCRKNWQKN